MSSDVEIANHVFRCRTFRRLAGQHTPEVPGNPGEDIRRACAMLILREALETVCGLGFFVSVRPAIAASGYGDKQHEVLAVIENPSGFNMLEMIDGTRDLQYVATQACLAVGVDPEKYQHMVDHANLRKFDRQFVPKEDFVLIESTPSATALAESCGVSYKWDGQNKMQLSVPFDRRGKEATPQECKLYGLGGYKEWEGQDAGKWIKPKNWKDVMPAIQAELRKDGYNFSEDVHR